MATEQLRVTLRNFFGKFPEKSRQTLYISMLINKISRKIKV